jgi:hypothetical protein
VDDVVSERLDDCSESNPPPVLGIADEDDGHGVFIPNPRIGNRLYPV